MLYLSIFEFIALMKTTKQRMTIFSICFKKPKNAVLIQNLFCLIHGMQVDTWYASVKNLKAIKKKEWYFLTRLKSNRLVNPANKGNVPLETVDIPQKGRVVHLKAYG